jgi:type II secretory pathway component PulK
LILALWAICFLSVLAVILGVEVRQKVSLVARLDEMARLRFISEAGIQKTIVELRKHAWGAYYDSLSDTFTDNLSLKDVDMADGSFSVGGYFQNDLAGDVSLRYSLIDEKGKININSASLSTLGKLFHLVLGLDEIEAQDLATAIIAWRGANESAEGSYYQNLEYPYKEKNGHFECLEEVLLVHGMDEDSFNRIKDYITVYGDGKVNINTASKPVLLALGLDADLVDKILSYRYGEDGILDTADDNIFDTPSNIIPKLSQFASLSDDEVTQLSGVVASSLVCNSGYFSVVSTARLHNHKNIAQTVAVINRDGKILSWREY